MIFPLLEIEFQNISVNLEKADILVFTSVYAAENYRYETVKTIIGTREVPGTTMTATIKTTNATSPDGSETSFGQSTSNTTIPLNETLI